MVRVLSENSYQRNTCCTKLIVEMLAVFVQIALEDTLQVVLLATKFPRTKFFHESPYKMCYDWELFERVRCMMTYRLKTRIEVWRPGYAEVLVTFTDTDGNIRQYKECLATEHNRNELWYQCGGGRLRMLDDTAFCVTTDNVHKRALIAVSDKLFVNCRKAAGYWVSEYDKLHTMLHTWFDKEDVGLVLSLRDNMELGLMTKAEANVKLVRHRRVMIFCDKVPKETRELFDHMVGIEVFQHKQQDHHLPEAYYVAGHGQFARQCRLDYSLGRRDSRQLTFFFK